MRYRFEWDPAKEKTNIQKHKVSFRRAATVFRDPNQLSIYDEEHSEYEDRWITMGIDDGGVLRVVVHTLEQVNENLSEIHIISARKATIRESRQYQEGVASLPLYLREQMKSEYDFSKGERGKFYSPDVEFSFPVYLEPDVDDFMNQLADERDIDIQGLVNEWLRANIKLIQSINARGTSKATS